jgi:hypothetical protein
VRVPLGKREVLGVVWEVLPDSGELPEAKTRDIAGVLEGLAPLSATWSQYLISCVEMCAFLHKYIQTMR